MPNGAAIFEEWLGKVRPRIQHIRDAYLAYGVLEELMNDAGDKVALWQSRADSSTGELAEEALSRLRSEREVLQSYETAYEKMGIQMEVVRAELDNLQDKRLTLSAMCQSLDIQQLGVEVLEKAYDAIGPDSAIDNALNTAKQAVSELDAENKARKELNDFLQNP